MAIQATIKLPSRREGQGVGLCLESCVFKVVCTPTSPSGRIGCSTVAKNSCPFHFRIRKKRATSLASSLSPQKFRLIQKNPFHSPFTPLPFLSLPFRNPTKSIFPKPESSPANSKKIFEDYGEKFNPDKSVGVIVPYRNQISMIRREIEALKIPELLQISIDTVERYQGSQRDVIIYSTTVTHRYQLDFLCANTFEEDGAIIDRKLNVALTRARCRLIITGHEPTLRQDPLYCDLIDFIRKERQG